MIQKMLAVYDAAAKMYLSPFQVPRTEIGLRSFTDAVNAQSHDLSNHPEDYTLLLLGEFNNTTGQFTNHEPAPQLVATALSVKRQAEPGFFDTPTEAVTALNGANSHD